MVLNKDRYLLFLQRIQHTANSEIKVLMADIIVLSVRKKAVIKETWNHVYRKANVIFKLRIYQIE